MGTINPNLTDMDQFKAMMDHKRSVVKISLLLGLPVFPVLTIENLIAGDNLMAFSTSLMLLILILLGVVIMMRIEEKSEYKIYSILFRVFNAVVGD